MQEILVRTKGNVPAKDKPRVYFACHPGIQQRRIHYRIKSKTVDENRRFL